MILNPALLSLGSLNLAGGVSNLSFKAAIQPQVTEVEKGAYFGLLHLSVLTLQLVPAASRPVQGNGCTVGGESVCSGEVILLQVCGLPIPHESENLVCCCSCFFDERQAADSQAKLLMGNITCKKSPGKIHESHASISGAAVPVESCPSPHLGKWEYQRSERGFWLLNSHHLLCIDFLNSFPKTKL